MAVEKGYYETLGVGEEATNSEIKKACYQKALGEAYQVPSDPEKCESYDRYGKDGVMMDSMVDPTVLFGMMLGNEIFENYVGQLTLLSSAPPEFDPDLPLEVQKPILKKIMKALQDEREAKLIKILKDCLEPYVKGQKDEFMESAEVEAHRLSLAAFGKALLVTIGYIYRRQAAKEIGKEKRYMKAQFLAEWVRDKRHSRNTQSAAAQAAIAYIKLRERWRMCNKEQIKGKNTIRMAEEIKGAMFVSFWQMNVADIEMTVSHVCQAVLGDPGASKDILKLRARGLKILGKIFQGTTAQGEDKN